MKKRLSQMSAKKRVEAAGFLLIACGLILFVICITANYLKGYSQAGNYQALIPYWKKGFLLLICGVIALIFSPAFSSDGKK